jgi:hypothetical protein
MFPLNYVGIFSGLICGFLFGYVLENAGFGSPCKLTAQFRLNDWSVFKVMFTAIVVSAAGLVGLHETGLIAADSVFVPPALLVASGVGGALVGVGFAVGGYCPGTSIVGFFSGRLDALIFIIGLLIGTFVFAGVYGPVIETLMAAGEVASGDTFTEAYGISELLVLMIMVVALVAIFYVGSWFERRSSGPVTAEQAVTGAVSERNI